VAAVTLNVRNVPSNHFFVLRNKIVVLGSNLLQRIALRSIQDRVHVIVNKGTGKRT
jgi:hypothetical protein